MPRNSDIFTLSIDIRLSGLVPRTVREVQGERYRLYQKTSAINTESMAHCSRSTAELPRKLRGVKLCGHKNGHNPEKDGAHETTQVIEKNWRARQDLNLRPADLKFKPK